MTKPSQSPNFRERLGSEAIGLNDYKVDDLRKIASHYHIAGSHGLKKPDLVAAINTARAGQGQVQ